MLSMDDVTPTPEIAPYVSLTSLCRRSSICSARDATEPRRPSVSLSRWDSLKGSSSSLTGSGSTVTSSQSWRRESIVEAMDKKCRETVSSRLRNQLPEHLRRSSTTIGDLPVIVRPASRQSLTSGPSRSSRRSSTQLYQGLPATGGVPSLQSATRRHSTTAAAGSTTPRSGRWLSHQPPVDLDDLLHCSTPSSPWSTLERPATDADANWSPGDKCSTLPTRLRPDSDTIDDQSPCGYSYTGSTSSAETFSDDRKADFDGIPDSDDEYGCDEVSVESFTFTPSRNTDRREPTAATADLLDQTADQTSKEVPVVDGDQKTIRQKHVAELQLIRQPEGRVNNVLSNEAVTATNSTKSVPLISTTVSLTNGISDRTASKTTELHRNTSHVVEKAHFQPTAAKSGQLGPRTSEKENGNWKASDAEVLPTSKYRSRTEDPIQPVPETRSSTEPEDRPRYRTTFSLAIGGPPASTCGLSYPQTESQKSTEQEDFPPPPPLPLSAQPALIHSGSLSDEWTEDFVAEKNSMCAKQPSESVQTGASHTGHTEGDKICSAELRDAIVRADSTILTFSKPHINGDNSSVTAQNTASIKRSGSATTICEQFLGSQHTTTNYNSKNAANNSVQLLPDRSTEPVIADSKDSSAVTDRTNQTQHDVGVRLSNVELVARRNGSSSEPRRQKPPENNTTRAATGCRNGQPVSVVVLGQSGRSSSRFDRQVNGFHAQECGHQRPLHVERDVQKHARCQAETPAESPDRCAVTSRTETAPTSSGDRKSGYVTSGCGPDNVVETRATTTRATLIPVRLQPHKNSSGAVNKPVSMAVVDQGGPSVDRSWETLLIDSSRTAVVPHRTTTKCPVPATTRPPESQQIGSTRPPVIVIPVKQSADCRRQFSDTSGRSRPRESCSTGLDLSPPERVSSSYNRDATASLTLDVDVVKSGLALGFSIDGGRDSLFGDRPLTVKRVLREGERLNPGDELLSANGRPLSDLSHFVALNFLKSLPDGNVHLVLRRQNHNN